MTRTPKTAVAKIIADGNQDDASTDEEAVLAVVEEILDNKKKGPVVDVQECTLDDIETDTDNPATLGKEKTDFVRIGGTDIDDVKVPLLWKLCSRNKVDGWSRMNKVGLCGAIMKAVKTKGMDVEMYKGTVVGDTVSLQDTPAKKISRSPVKPAAVTQLGTYFCFINAYTHQSLRVAVVSLGNRLNLPQLDIKGKPHIEVYKLIAELFNSETEGMGLVLLKDDVLENAGVRTDEASFFDELTWEDCMVLLQHINAKYTIAIWNCRKSGSHDEFRQYVGNTPWLLYYHYLLEECGLELASLATADMPSDVVRYSIKEEKEAFVSLTLDTNTRRHKTIGEANMKSFSLMVKSSEDKIGLMREHDSLLKQSSEQELMWFAVAFCVDLVKSIGLMREKLSESMRRKRVATSMVTSAKGKKAKTDATEDLVLIEDDVEMYRQELGVLTARLEGLSNPNDDDISGVTNASVDL